MRPVSSRLRYLKTDERKFAEKLTAASSRENERGLQKAKNELAKAKTRIGTLDRIVSKLCEDNVEGKISDERSATMLAGYEDEQTGLRSRTVELESLISESTSQTEGIESFLRVVRSFTEVTELTLEIVHELISTMRVGEAVYTPPQYNHWGRSKTQEIRITYHFIGDVSETFKDE